MSVFSPFLRSLSSPRAFVAGCMLGLMVPHPCLAQNEGAGKKPTSSAVTASPDLIIELLDSEGDGVETLGENFFNDEANQTSASFVSVGHKKDYLIHVKNTGHNAAKFQVKLNGFLSPKGAATAWNPAGWTAHATPKDSAEEIISQMQSGQGWTTPSISAGEEIVIALSFLAPATTSPAPADASFRVSAKGGAGDVVVGKLRAQFIAKLQWNPKGELENEADWQDVTPSTIIDVEQNEMIPLRAVKAIAADDWPDVMNGPTWLWQNVEVDGETVFLRADNLTDKEGILATVTCGNTLTFKVRVSKGDAFIEYDTPTP